MKLITLIFFLAPILVGCIKQEISKISSAGASSPPPKGTPVRWAPAQLGTGLSLEVSTDFTNNFIPADDDSSGDHPIKQMMKQWNSTTGSYNFFNLSAPTTANIEYGSLSSYNDSEMGIYKHNSWFNNVSSSALAVTQYFGARRSVGNSNEWIEIIHADIILNYKDYDFSLDETSHNEYDLKSVILHELGHFIGLPHQASFATDSVMQPFLSIAGSKRTVSLSDQDDVQGLYGLSSLSTLNHDQGSQHSAAREKPHSSEGSIIRGVIELRSNGDCLHYENNQLVHTHQTKKIKKRLP